MRQLSVTGFIFVFLTAFLMTSSDAKLMEKAEIEKGWRMEVTRSVGMDGTESYTNGYQAPFRVFQKIQFTDQVTKTDGKMIQEVTRNVGTADFNTLDPESGQMVKQEIIPSGSLFRVLHTQYGSELFDGSSGDQIWDEDKVSAFSPPVVPALWPEGDLKRGQKWSYRGNEVVSRIALIDIIGGTIELGIEDISKEPSTGLDTALIRGRLQTKVDLGSMVMDFNADVSIDLPLKLGIPFMVKFDGTLSGAGTVQDQYGQPVGFQVNASGTYLQIAKPSSEIFASISSGTGTTHNETEVIVEKGKIDASGALRIPMNSQAGNALSLGGGMSSSGGNLSSSQGSFISSGGSSGSSFEGTLPPSGSSSSSSMDSDSPSQKGTKAPVYQYRLYQDVTENAFTVMVPEGWQVQGGIMKISPNNIRTVVDGCGKKLYFTIYDPVTMASITYFPTEMYASSAPGTSIINVPAGQVLNGMVQMPQLLSPSQYVRQVVFPSQSSDVQNVQWGKTESLASLASAWNRAFHAEDQIPPQIVAESIEVAYDRGNTRFGELWTSLITSVTVYTSTIWMPDFTVAASAPLEKTDELAPVLKAVITSFRMNSTWLANASAGFDKCTKGVVATQEKIREMDRKISQKLRQVQSEINRIDNDIVSNTNKTRSVIQEHEHNTLMGEDKYEDTGTGARYLIDMGYDRNFTNGEQIIQTNDWTYEPPPGYRDMKNVHVIDE
ncbi:exported hypothetical protein [Desulfamplus magnetovallimortis]|uniref:Uncharacterized protein n=1 Tax=Desulfamplus magnetovallimortis TaxID=1246637 RepID=A0A1W1H6F7_9BACT|nr:hypothetical protein [Desulfamplus magnetovallimortis]SLM28071.1 exported hypothetical protein [Desulfamplus magnetovallimortis]